MSETIGFEAFSRSEKKRLVRLLRGLLKGPAVRLVSPNESQGDRAIRLGLDDRELTLPQTLLDKAVRLGLLESCAGQIAARPEAAGFLRRLLSEVPEDAFGEQHRELVEDTAVVGNVRQPVRRNLAESPLAILARLKDRGGCAFLPSEAVEAGERLAADFERGQLQPSVTARWEPKIDSRTPGLRAGPAELCDSAMAARLRVAGAADAMGPELSGVALDICCFGKGLEQVERERGWPARSAKLMLRTALLQLARHYRPPPPTRRSHHWGGEGYRPEAGCVR